MAFFAGGKPAPGQAWVVVLVLCSSVLISLLEPGLKWADSLWWSIVTLATVGYGDFFPVTGGGRVVSNLPGDYVVEPGDYLVVMGGRVRGIAAA